MNKKDKLIEFNGDIKQASLFFNKSERTIRRWLKRENLYNPDHNYCPNKLSQDDANKIRDEYNNEIKQIDLAKKYNVSQATIANIINNKIYKYNLQLTGGFDYKYSINLTFN